MAQLMDVVMTGKSLNKNVETNKEEKVQLAEKTSINEPGQTFASPEEVKRKPAILIETNTLKPVTLEYRKTNKKKLEIQKIGRKKKKKSNSVNKNDSNSSNSEEKKVNIAKETLANKSSSIMTLSAETSKSEIDIGESVTQKLKQFQEMEDEFQNIIGEMNIDQIYIESSDTGPTSSEVSLPPDTQEQDYTKLSPVQFGLGNNSYFLSKKSIPTFMRESKNLSVINIAVDSAENVLKVAPTTQMPYEVEEYDMQINLSSAETSTHSMLKVQQEIETDRESSKSNNVLDKIETVISDPSSNIIENESLSNNIVEEVADNFEDLLDGDFENSIMATKINLKTRPNIKTIESHVGMRFLPEKNFDEMNRKIHHFCTTVPTRKLEAKEKLASYLSHAPAMFMPKNVKNYDGLTRDKTHDLIVRDFDSSKISKNNETSVDTLSEQNEEKKYAEIAARIMAHIEKAPHIEEKSFLKLQSAVEKLFDQQESPNMVQGNKLVLTDDVTRFINQPPPPKFHVTPETITSELARKYVSKEDDESIMEFSGNFSTEAKNVDIVEDPESDEKHFKERLLNRLHHSLNDLDTIALDDYESGSDSESSADEFDFSERFESILDRQRRKRFNERPKSASSLQSKLLDLNRRCHSQPSFSQDKEQEKHSVFATDFNTAMDETKNFYQQMQNMRNEHPVRLNQEIKPVIIEEKESKLETNQRSDVEDLKKKILFEDKKILERYVSSMFISEELPSLTSNRKWKSESNMHDMTVPDLKGGSAVIWWKENYWYKWLDEIYNLEYNITDTASSKTEDANECSFAETWKNEVTLDICTDLPENQIIGNEISQLTMKIENQKSSVGLIGFLLCRRGALYRKIGNIKNALIDLNSAINLEPKLLDSYWHRHLIHLAQGNIKKALEDLDHVTKYNPRHKNALRSKGEIYKNQGESAMAITCFSQAINVDPRNHELYYSRAELLEERGDMILSLEDHKVADQLNPSNTTGLWKIASYHFQIGSWMAAVTDYTSLISRKPKESKAYLFRAQAHSKLGHHEKGIIDLSTCIHLQPNNPKAFYHRGCLLRKYSPQQALQDLSVSLLLDSTVNNIDAYNHRAILYTDLNMLDQARTDFELVIRLNRKSSPAHVNIGLIEMKKKGDLSLAIKRFNIALRMNPSYVRAIICRAEAYERLGKIDDAILDYTRAIMMNPGNIDYRVARGRLLLKKNEFELASFHIRQCAAMSSKKVGLSTQQAVVETFLKNHNKAIQILEVAVKSQPVMHLYTLLGKTFMKAIRYTDAIEQFQIALDLVRPYNSKMSWPNEASEIFFLIGMCYKELKRFPMALDALNNSVRINNENPQVYYERGLIKMKLGLSKGVHDFNKALACKSTFFQAYLARAMYYSINKRYAKAIMNCNEAIRINPSSVRAYLYRGSLKYSIKAYGLAIKDLTEAINIDSCCWLAYFNRAICYHEKRFYFKALKDYSIVLVGPSNLKMKALLNRGLLYYQINDISNAVDDFNMALEKEPNNVDIILALGLCYQKIGENGMSIQSYSDVLKINPFAASALIGRGNVIMKSMDVNRARRDFVRALHINPLSTDARINLAISLQLQGRFMKAWNMFTKTLQLDPKNGESFEGRAMVNLRMGNTLGAFLDMNAAVKICRTAKSLTNRGVVNQCLGDLRAAMTDYQQAIKVDPSYSLAHYNAANIYFFNRQFDQAIAYYNSAINWNPNEANAYINRAVAKTLSKGKRDVDEILNDFKTAESFSTEWSHLYYNRGLYLHSLQKYDDAEKDFSKAINLRPDYALFYKKRAETRGCLSANKEALDDYRKVISLLG